MIQDAAQMSNLSSGEEQVIEDAELLLLFLFSDESFLVFEIHI